MINTFRTIPKALFRLSYGREINLRPWSLQRQTSFDVRPDSQGLVRPKALTQRPPNGASMRPNTTIQQNLLKRMKGQNVVVYSVAEGVVLPNDLIIVHERGDHYSLQATVPMSVEQLSAKITTFLQRSSTVLTKEQFIHYYPQATDTSDKGKV
ncbi:uncharacterized protein BP5553_04516 [Venustampulla echinocandica]|uniref:Tse2 ADP-ribosyltransferase toxin domain-containing protein n=1 Tax=Venustampulla echinocandica TaxID=2656787 RepID=A0A370TNI4_9HELO|nr:uncharacterized protein BP5553_04516 [Venustampulla echinocandica]RDL37083.1 hypothetical protein BP5553_04516 [Venustampulla echinocandica]